MATYDGSNLAAYVNGNAVADESITGVFSADVDVVFSNRGVSQQSLDDAKFFDRALSGEEVRALVSAQSGLETGNRLTRYRHGEGQVIVAPDAKIGHAVDDFQSGGLIAKVDQGRLRDGDEFGLSDTDAIAIGGNIVLYKREGEFVPIGNLVASNDIEVEFTSEHATPEAVQALVRAIYFRSDAETPETHDRRAPPLPKLSSRRASSAMTTTMMNRETKHSWVL